MVTELNQSFFFFIQEWLIRQIGVMPMFHEQFTRSLKIIVHARYGQFTPSFMKY